MGIVSEVISMGKWNISREKFPYALYYTICWSPWGLMDRWVINRLVPSEAGIFQLWTLKGKNLALLTTETAYYGGLRNSLREVTDDLAPAGERLRKLIGNQECWFRFTISPIREYLEDLKSFFSKEIYASNAREILIREVEDFKRFPAPPPDIRLSSTRSGDFGPPLPSQK